MVFRYVARAMFDVLVAIESMMAKVPAFCY